MLTFIHQLIIRLLIVAIAISPLQIAMATDFDQSHNVAKCQALQTSLYDIAGMDMDNGCSSEQGNHCVDLSVCATHFNFSSMQTSNSFLLLARTVIHKKFSVDSDTVSTHYSEPLRRPPRA